MNWKQALFLGLMFGIPFVVVAWEFGLWPAVQGAAGVLFFSAGIGGGLILTMLGEDKS